MRLPYENKIPLHFSNEIINRIDIFIFFLAAATKQQYARKNRKATIRESRLPCFSCGPITIYLYMQLCPPIWTPINLVRQPFWMPTNLSLLLLLPIDKIVSVNAASTEQEIVGLSGAGFSLRGLDLGSAKTRRLKPALLKSSLGPEPSAK